MIYTSSSVQHLYAFIARDKRYQRFYEIDLARIRKNNVNTIRTRLIQLTPFFFFRWAAIDWCILSVIGDKLLRFKNGIIELIGRQAIFCMLLLLVHFVLINHYDTCNMHKYTHTRNACVWSVYKEVYKCVLTGFNFHCNAVRGVLHGFYTRISYTLFCCMLLCFCSHNKPPRWVGSV